MRVNATVCINIININIAVVNSFVGKW